MVMNALMRPWSFEVPDINSALKPIQAGIDRYNKQTQQYEENQRAETQLGMQRERLGMEKERFQREEFDAQRQTLGNLGMLAAQYPDKYGPQWKNAVEQFVAKARERNPSFAVPQEYYDVRVGPHIAISDAKMVPQYLEYQMKKAAEGRASAAEGRAAELHAPQLQTAQIQAATAKREFDSPKMGTADLGPDHSRIFYDPRTGAETGRLEGPKKGVDKDVSSVEHQLRGEVGGLAKSYRTIRDSAANVEALIKQPSAASDIALIFQYMKILDPESVVREGEFATAQNAAGVGDRVVNIYNRILNGERLNDNQRADFVKQAQTLAATKLNQYQRDIDQYRGVAERSKVNPANVILDQELLSQRGKIAPGNAGQGLPGGRLPAVQQAYDEARQAIAAGANKAAVIQRLRQNGIDPSGL